MEAIVIPYDLPLPFGETPRSEGIHLSGILRKIAIENGALEIDQPESLDLVEVGGGSLLWWEQLDEVARLRISMGVAWEQWYLPRLTDVVDHPGELQLDGIFLTPDGESLDYIYSVDEAELCLFIHEVKLTYKSCRTVGDLTTQFLWMAQVKAYCRASKTQTAYLHVLFVCGDYSFPMRPMLRVWKITFTDLELDDNWNVVTTYRDHHVSEEE